MTDTLGHFIEMSFNIMLLFKFAFFVYKLQILHVYCLFMLKLW